MGNEENNGGIILGVLAIVCGFISFFVCWWLSIVGIALGLLGLLLPKKTCAGIAVGLNIIMLITNLIVLSAVGIL